MPVELEVDIEDETGDSNDLHGFGDVEDDLVHDHFPFRHFLAPDVVVQLL